MTVERPNLEVAMDQAIAWHLRLPTATRDDWLAFTAWLEASPDHAEAYDRLALDDAMLTPVLDEAPTAPAPVAANDRDEPERLLSRWRYGAIGGAAAAAVTLAIITTVNGGDGDARYSIATAPGERRQIAFGDGTRILVNGASKVTLDRSNPRFAALDHGEATFLIRHDAARPFTLESGGLTLRDLGTAFNVARDGKRLGVQVSEGVVLFEPDREGLTLRPGVALAVDERDRRIELSRVAVEDVGGWRAGRLTFGDTPLPSVAAALGRATGAKVTVAPALAEARFTGTMTVAHGADAMVPRLAKLTGATWRRNGEEWILSARDDDTP